jgi:hypothetical protein
MVGCPMALTQGELRETIEVSFQAFQQRRLLTLPEIRASIRAKCNKSLMLDAPKHLFARHPSVRSFQACPIGEKRRRVSDDGIGHYFGTLSATVSGAPAQVVFKYGGNGPSDLGRYTEDALPPSGRVHGSECPSPDITDRRVQRQLHPSMTGHMSQDCRWRHSDTRICSEKNGNVLTDETYVDLDIFCHWARDTFIPDVIARRKCLSCYRAAFLITENCSAHRGLEFDCPCTAYGTIPVWLPSHSSNSLEILDLCTFPVMKRLIFRMNELEKANLGSATLCRPWIHCSGCLS